MITNKVQLPFYARASLLTTGYFIFPAMLYAALGIIFIFKLLNINFTLNQPEIKFFVQQKYTASKPLISRTLANITIGS
jgi:hypothetical protein